MKKAGIVATALIALMLVAAIACGTDAESSTAPAPGAEREQATRPADVQKHTVTGSVIYRQRIALSPDAVVTVKLLDVSRADAPAITIGEQIIENPGQVPISFEIAYDPNDLDERFTYAVRAEIRDRGQLLFTTTTTHHVITRGNPNETEIVLEMVAKPPVETPVAQDVLCMMTLAAQLPIEFEFGKDSIPTGFDGINRANCNFPKAIEKITVVLTAEDGHVHTETFTLAEASERVAFPLPEGTLSMSTKEMLLPGEYERQMTATATDGQAYDLTDVGALGTVTILPYDG